MTSNLRDGAHRHGGTGVVELGEDGLRLLANHALDSKCMQKPLKKDDILPFTVVMLKDGDKEGMIYCGFCKKELGKCGIKFIRS